MSATLSNNAGTPQLYGLVLAGGASTRMKKDKAGLMIAGETQLERAFKLLTACCENVFVSVRPEQQTDSTRRHYPCIVDRVEKIGPLAGILAAQHCHKDVAWLILACDLPMLNARTLNHLIAQRDTSAFATAYRSVRDGLPEPLCAIFEPHSKEHIEEFIANDVRCPRKILIRSDTHLLDPVDPHALDNVNTPDDLNEVLERFDLGEASSG